MRKIIFLLIVTFIFVACDSKDTTDETDVLVAFTNTYKSKDQIHHYAITSDYLYKQRISDLKIIWKKQCTPPPPITIDLGYGEKKDLAFNQPYILLETSGSLITLWRAAYENQSYNYLGLYSISGDFIKNTKCNSFKSLPILIELKDGKLLLVDRSNKGFTIVDNELNILESNDNIVLNYYGNIEIIEERKYVTYDFNNFSLCDLDRGSIDSDIPQFIKLQYPNESNQPKYTISNILFSDNVINMQLNVTLYDGSKNTIRVKMDSNTGELKPV